MKRLQIAISIYNTVKHFKSILCLYVVFVGTNLYPVNNLILT